MTSHILTIRLTREDTSIPWGFRLEGGIDVGHAVNIQRIVPGSIADYRGLQAGDHIVRINQSETKWMKHDDVKMEIIRSNNDLEMTVQRGGEIHYSNEPVTMIPYQDKWAKPISPQPASKTTVWKPTVVSSLQMSPTDNRPVHVTHTSLEATPDYRDYSIGVSHNVSPTPFGQSPPAPGQELITKGPDGRFRKIGHSSYNSPMGLYAQKNRSNTFEQTMSAVSGSVHSSLDPHFNSQLDHSGSSPPSKSMYCGSCGGFIRGVFVKVQGRIPMHPECLKCCKCGVGLRNVGYFYIKEQLYCEKHAKQAAPPPEPGMKPVVVYK